MILLSWRLGVDDGIGYSVGQAGIDLRHGNIVFADDMQIGVRLFGLP